MDNPTASVDLSKNLDDRTSNTVRFIRGLVPESLATPKLAIVCGSGLGGLVNATKQHPRVVIDYAGIPGLPVSTIQGHEGKMVFGLIGKAKTPVMLLAGRAHFYEGHDMPLVTYATRVCKRLGVDIMIVTNAAGGLNPLYSVGDIVAINDHINLAGLVGTNPLRGPNEDTFGVRFPPLSDAYDLALRRRAHRAWAKFGLGPEKRLHEGVYAFSAGPTFETRAECRMFKILGADLVGMSTIPEVIVARHSGIRVLAFSIVTNTCVLEAPVRGDDALVHSLSDPELHDFISKGSANHAEVLAAMHEAGGALKTLVKAVVDELYD